jgi:ABC-type branched-subunit amino acid transport system ATPase component
VTLKQLSLVAYRGISHLTLADLGSISLIVGDNDVGKSSVLEAAGLVLRPLDRDRWVSASRHVDVEALTADGLRRVFPSVPRFADLCVEGVTTVGLRTVTARWPVMEDGHVARLEVGVDGTPDVALEFPASSATVHDASSIRVAHVTSTTHYSTRAMADDLSAMTAAERALASQVLHGLEPEIQNIVAFEAGGRRCAYVSYAERGVVDLGSLGDGARRSVALAVALVRASGGVLLVDDIALGFHHSSLRGRFAELLRSAADSSVQVLATTHDLEAVDALLCATEDAGVDGSLGLYWLRCMANQHRVRRYDADRVRRLREEGLDVR